MSDTELLIWLRGTGLQISVAIFLLGTLFRIIQNLALGQTPHLAPPRANAFSAGMATIVRRSLFHPGMTYRGYFTLIAGYTFHLCFLTTLFFLGQHIMLFQSVLGFGWPALPRVIIDFTALLGIAALIAVLIHRVVDPVVQQLTDYQDYLAWLLTVLPLITGFLVMHPVGFSYKFTLSLHILSAEVLLVAMPFTKLNHFVSIFFSRWYNGALFGLKGVKS